MTTYIDNSHFRRLTTAVPEDICRNARCRYDSGNGRYSLDIWGEEYVIDCARQRIDRTSKIHPAPHDYFSLFVIYYLLAAPDVSLAGEWISEKDLPGGATFFRGPHRIPTELISGRFDNDVTSFRDCCTALGGKHLDLGDAAYRFDLAPDLPVAVVYWQGDQDFPAEAGLLYDRSLARLLPLDIVFALAVSVCARIGAAAAA